jgi:redox-sensitive bicupin YhaK (pirin superfamily)
MPGITSVLRYHTRIDGMGPYPQRNDDTMQPRAFPPHPHSNMEIITLQRRNHAQGPLGNSGRTGAGDVQVMSAAAGLPSMPNSMSRTKRLPLFQI